TVPEVVAPAEAPTTFAALAGTGIPAAYMFGDQFESSHMHVLVPVVRPGILAGPASFTFNSVNTGSVHAGFVPRQPAGQFLFQPVSVAAGPLNSTFTFPGLAPAPVNTPTSSSAASALINTLLQPTLPPTFGGNSMGIYAGKSNPIFNLAQQTEQAA